MRKWLPRIALGVGAFVLLLVLVVTVTPQGRAVAKTTGLVAQVIPNAPVQPLGWFTQEPVRERVTYPSPSGQAEADIYRLPGERERPALVFFLGVNPAGRDDPRVVNLATALARTGYVVLVPWSENMVGGRVDYGDVELLVAAFEYLKGLDFVDSERIGSGGFCVGSSLLTIAAADPRIREDVQFVNFFSGYFDGRDFLAQFSARHRFYQDEVRAWRPDPLTVEVFQRMLIERLPDAGESALLEGHFMDGRLLSPEQVEDLSPPALAVYRLLEGTEDLDEARRFITQLPSETLEEIDALSPRHYVEDVQAALWIMHDRDDELAPFEESLRLYDAVGDRPNVRFTEFEFFQHVDPAADAGLFNLVSESWKLLRHLYQVVRFTT